MNIRLLGHSIVAVSAICLIVWGGFRVWSGIEDSLASQGITAEIGAASASTVYSMAEERWTEFPIGGNPSKIRLLSHADTGASLAVSPDDALPYGVMIEFIGSDGSVLDSRLVLHRAGLSSYRDVQSQAPVDRAFYLDRSIAITDIRTTVISLPPNTVLVRLRRDGSDPRILDVKARLYDVELPSDSRLAYLWQRLPREQQEKLARGNIYPPEFLTETEKRAILRNRWRPMGPAGVEGRDYNAATMYTLPAESVERMAKAILPSGQFVDEHLHATFAIPAQGGMLRLDALSIEDGSAIDMERLDLSWFGQGFTERSRHSLKRSDAGFFDLPVRGGLIDVTVGRPAVVRAWIDGREFLPDQGKIRIFSAAEDLSFPIANAGDGDTLMRIDLLCSCYRDGSAKDAIAVPFQVLDAKGDVISQGELSHIVTPARYDFVSPDPLDRVSERSSHYFRLSAQASSLRLSAEAPVYVMAFNRPGGMPRRLELPQDAYLADRDGTRRTWFPLLPEGADRLIQEDRSILLETRHRPPEDDPLLIAGSYQFEDFSPAGDWAGRQILERRDDPAPPRDEALASAFSPIAVNKDARALWVAAPPSRTVTPSLLYLMGGNAPTKLIVAVDGRTVFDGRVRPGMGELSLGHFPAGPHEIAVTGGNVRSAHVNFVRPKGPYLFKRLAFVVQGRRLQVPLLKRTGSQETISGTYYAPGKDTRCTVEVGTAIPQAVGVGPFTDLTILPLAAALSPQDGPGPFMLASSRQSIAVGTRFSFGLGDDIPPGKLDLDFKFASECGGGYLILTRILPGAAMPSVIRNQKTEEE